MQMVYAFCRPTVRGPTPIATKLTTTMIGRRSEQPPGHSEKTVQVRDQQHRRADLARDAQQHNKIDVARPLGHDPRQANRARPLVADQFLDPRHRHRADGGIDRREQATEKR